MSSGEDDRFEVRLGRTRSRSGARQITRFMNGLERGAKRSTRAGRSMRRSGHTIRQMTFHRRVVVKASIKRMVSGGPTALRKHLEYIGRDGADEGGKRAKLYGNGVAPDIESIASTETQVPDRSNIEQTDDAQPPVRAFIERCKDDRHHFRFIVSPEDSAKMQDLSAFTRELVTTMERDLGTKLDWVAANHFDTGQPHVHLVVRGVRDDGKDLVMPRRYISQTIRERAQDLVSVELGPVSQMEGRLRVAGAVDPEGFTRLDKELAAKVEDGVIDMRGPVPPGRVWHRQLQVRRLKFLASMGLAERQGSGRWSVTEDFGDTLRSVAERKEIVRAVHRSMEGRGGHTGELAAKQLVTERNRFDPNRLGAEAKTGIVRHFGRANDTKPGGFVIIETTDGQSLFTRVADDETFETMRRGQVVTFAPHHIGPRKIDRSIVAYAREHDGTYSEARHATSSGRVSAAYAQAHARRLEALRRKNFVTRSKDGSWRIPADYLDRATQYESERALRQPTAILRNSQQTLDEMKRARGVTWLDRAMQSGSPLSKEGKSPIFDAAMVDRKATLRELGINVEKGESLLQNELNRLEKIDLEDAAKLLREKTGKPYASITNTKRIEGIYREAIERPSGKYAVIERSRDFTLVPWRSVMEKRLGKSLVGKVSAGGISWDVTGRRGPSR